ncbi:MAG: 4Fe-4S dicluster domain-containing protein [Bacteroidetes bacterium]|nr:4Fe-4S dicluster domain-containing protein [Bacteroidota bacterium]
MKSFGYNITEDRQIDFDANDRNVTVFINEIEPSILLCMGCGSCTATCTTGHFTDFNIRKIHTLIQRGELKHLKKEIMKCMLCGKCQLVCPRGVNLRNLILSIHTALEKSGL